MAGSLNSLDMGQGLSSDGQVLAVGQLSACGVSEDSVTGLAVPVLLHAVLVAASLNSLNISQGLSGDDQVHAVGQLSSLGISEDSLALGAVPVLGRTVLMAASLNSLDISQVVNAANFHFDAADGAVGAGLVSSVLVSTDNTLEQPCILSGAARPVCPVLADVQVLQHLHQVVGHGVVRTSVDISSQSIGVVDVFAGLDVAVAGSAGAQHAGQADTCGEVDDDQGAVGGVQMVEAILTHNGDIDGAVVDIDSVTGDQALQLGSVGGVLVDIGGVLDLGGFSLTGLFDGQVAGLHAGDTDHNAGAGLGDSPSQGVGLVLSVILSKVSTSAPVADQRISVVSSEGVHTGFSRLKFIHSGFNRAVQSQGIGAQDQLSSIVHSDRTSFCSQCRGCQAHDHANCKDHSQEPLCGLHWNLLLY